jgi:hypothetical protein
VADAAEDRAKQAAAQDQKDPKANGRPQGQKVEPVALIELGAIERALLREAAQISGLTEPKELLRTALTEFLERRRFQTWVEALDQDPTRPGRA